MLAESHHSTRRFVSARRLNSKQQLEIDERREAIDGAADFAVAAFAVEVAGTGVRVEGVEANGVGRPLGGDSARFLDAEAADAFALVTRVDSHCGEIERAFAGVEVFSVDGPGLAGGEGQRGDELTAESGDVDGSSLHLGARASFRGSRDPVALAVLPRVVAIDCRAKQYQIGNVAIGGGLEVNAHADLARWG